MIRQRILSVAPALLLAAAAAMAQTDSARITYTKEFPGSQPDYIFISVQHDGQCLFRTAPDDKPVEFQISAGSAEKIFTLAHKLNFFQGLPLESKRKVAQLGKKTLAFEDGATHNSTSYNYTENADGLALTSLFEGLSRTEWHRDRLEYLLRFDRLGIMDELLAAEADLDQNQLVEPALLRPIMEKIRANDSLVRVAQERAAGILAKLPAQP